MSSASSASDALGAFDQSSSPVRDGLLKQTADWLRKCGIGRVELTFFALADLLIIVLLALGYLSTVQQSPELFAWGRRLLNAQRGLLMAAVLPVGGVALLAAIVFARGGRRAGVIAGLVTALLAGATYLTIAGLDFDSKRAHRLVPGLSFRPNQRYVARRFGVRLPKDWNVQRPAATPVTTSPPSAPISTAPDMKLGRDLFMRVCASCHGLRGDGVAGSGVQLRTSQFVADRDDEELVAFLKVGRQPWDADSVTKVQMPARGGDPRVTDADLRNVVAYLRDMQERAGAATIPTESSAAATQDAAAATQPAGAASAAGEEPIEFVAHRSNLPDPPEGPQGLAAEYFNRLLRPRWLIPSNAVQFFSLFFALSGVAVVHVVLALAGAAALLVAALRDASASGLAPGLLVVTIAWWWASAGVGLTYVAMYVL